MEPDRFRLIESVCLEALDRDPGRRAAFLDQACAGDTELRREVESLLAAESGLPGFLSQPAFAGPSSVPTLTQPPPAGSHDQPAIPNPPGNVFPGPPAADSSGSRRRLEAALDAVGLRWRPAPGADVRDTRPLAHYLREAIRERTQQATTPAPGAIESRAASRYRRARAQLDPADLELIVAAIDLGYSPEQTALATGRSSAKAARAAVRQALRQLVAKMGTPPNPSGSVSALEVAVLDGESVDWKRARERAGEATRPIVQNLELVDQVAQASRASRRTPIGRSAGAWWRRPVFAASLSVVAAGHVVAGVLGYAAGVVSPTTVTPALAITTVLAFAAGSAWLGLGGRSDTRARTLAIFYLLIAAAFARQFLPGAGAGHPVALARALTPDAFLALFLWRFVGRFPRTIRYGPADRLCRVMEWTAAVAGGVLFGATTLLGLGLTPWLQVLGRSHPAGAYWGTVLGLAAPALPVAWVRARRSVPEERRRLALFTAGLALGILPMAGVLLAEVAFPRVDRLMAENRQLQGLALEGLLLLVPCITAYSVLVDRVLDVRVVVGRAIQHLFARATLTAISTLPFLAIAVYAYGHRDRSLSELLSAGRGATVASLTAAGLIMWAARPWVLRALDRRFFRAGADISRELTQMADEARSAASTADLAALLEGRLAPVLHAQRVVMLTRSPSGDAYTAIRHDIPDLPLRSALGALVAADARPLPVGPRETRSCLPLLPPAERDWVEDAGAAVLVPLVGARAPVGLISAGPKQDQSPYAAKELAFLAGIAPAAALALQLQAAQAHDEVPPAAECAACGAIGPTVGEHCGCGSPRKVATMPAVVAGKFRVERRVGAGGMGVVYRGHDLALDRVVALKTLPRLSSGASERLGREARVMASVVHPNLAMIYDLERWRNTPILVVEFLEGGTLAARLKGGPQPIRDTLPLGSVLASALDHLHRGGILHRDVKPSNIAFSARGIPKLLDFGLATLLSGPRDEGRPADAATAGPGPHATQSVARAGHVIAGTPLYLSPEAAQGDDPHPDFDLWGLAMVLYEAIAGTHPFAAKRVQDVLARAREAFVPDVRHFRPDCPEPVARAFAVMLSRDRSERPRTAASLGEILEGCTRA